MTLVHFGIADGFDHVAGQFADGEDLPVAPIQADVSAEIMTVRSRPLRVTATGRAKATSW